MRFKIGSVTYDAADTDRLSLKDILQLEAETKALGRPLKWSEFERWTVEINDLVSGAADETKSEAERQQAERELVEHDGYIWVMALMIWSSRRVAGETLTFGDAIDFPVGDLEFEKEPAGEKKPANPTKARPTPKGSGRAAAKHARGLGATKRTSPAASTNG
jgi:hypothetical protein